jgi:ADP-dependent NAD(P)H-hydrate dehydratase
MCPLRPSDSEPVTIDHAALARHPLPGVAGDSDKDGRGSVLVIGGTRETPGGVLLAGRASLRSGAGRLCLATIESVSAALAVGLPEARVVSLVETEKGSIEQSATEDLVSLMTQYDAVLLGSGTVDPDTITDLVRVLLCEATPDTTVVLDAAALAVVTSHPEVIRTSSAKVVLIPNPKEMGRLLERDEQSVCDAPARSLLDAVDSLGKPAALRGADTWITAPGEAIYVERNGTPALATAGSGDVLAGALTGLLARGAPPLNSMLWSVHAHAMTGNALAREVGLGFLASELVDALPVTFSSINAHLT